jgi:hypothetical protein
LALGTEHVFTGLDHVAFVVGLFLVVQTGRRSRSGTDDAPPWRRLVSTITAFTLAHSLTLGLAAAHVVDLPRAPVEATIAASVLLVGREALGSEETLTRTRPWLVAFLFGLVHGLGFAGAIGELPLARASFGVALLSFNVGIEIAQLLIVGALLLAVHVASRKAATKGDAKRRDRQRALAMRAACYAIGTLGAFWFFDRAYFVLR